MIEKRESLRDVDASRERQIQRSAEVEILKVDNRLEALEPGEDRR